MKVAYLVKLVSAVVPASDGSPSIAESISTLSTTEPLRAIRHLSALIKIDEYEVSRRMFGCRYEELSMSGARDVICELERRQLRKAA